eukprot:1149151-Pelagomonas_calceolata.AAC.1
MAAKIHLNIQSATWLQGRLRDLFNYTPEARQETNCHGPRKLAPGITAPNPCQPNPNFQLTVAGISGLACTILIVTQRF